MVRPCTELVKLISLNQTIGLKYIGLLHHVVKVNIAVPKREFYLLLKLKTFLLAYFSAMFWFWLKVKIFVTVVKIYERYLKWRNI